MGPEPNTQSSWIASIHGFTFTMPELSQNQTMYQEPLCVASLRAKARRLYRLERRLFRNKLTPDPTLAQEVETLRMDCISHHQALYSHS